MPTVPTGTALCTFPPLSRMPDPPISKVFREIGLADELGSGMRNTYKYTKLVSRWNPGIYRGPVFCSVVPLASIAVEKVGPQDETQVRTQVRTQVGTQVTLTDQILAFCVTALES